MRTSCASAGAGRGLLALHALAALLAGQQPVAPTPEAVGTPGGRNAGEYNAVNSFETGYRLSLLDGNAGKYRSDVNYRNGLRLLGSHLAVSSRDGHGGLFDEIVLTTLGLGNDPYESATLRLQKNGLYRYDLLWRQNDYFNPALTIAAGEHAMDTQRRLQDHDLTLWPQSRFKLRLGYSRGVQTGSVLTTVQEFDIRGDEFPLFADVRREDNQYRLGGEIELAGVKLTWLRRWEYFKEDTPVLLNGLAAGNSPADATALSTFHRAEPYHGATPGWLANLRAERKFWAVNGRFTYAGGRRNFILNESAIGADRFGGGLNRQIVVGGDARRPVATGDLSVSVFPTRRLTLTNSTSIHSTRIDGNATYSELENITRAQTIVNFQYLGIRTVTNNSEANYRAAKWLGLYGGYNYSDRRFRSIEGAAPPLAPLSGIQAGQTNHIHSGLGGVRLQPVEPLSILLEGEISRADRPFYPISDRNYHALGGRVRYRGRNLTLSAVYRENYNNNSISITAYSSRARNYSADASWAARDWLSLDAGYTKLHLDTISGLAFFGGLPNPQLTQDRSSLYLSNIHSANLALRIAIRKRADLFAGYSITQDTGDGRRSAAPAAADPVSAFLASAQTFPLRFQSPSARVSIRMAGKIRWNAGWQFYRYREDFGLFSVPQNYRAHTGYTSLVWAF